MMRSIMVNGERSSLRPQLRQVLFWVAAQLGFAAFATDENRFALQNNADRRPHRAERLPRDRTDLLLGDQLMVCGRELLLATIPGCPARAAGPRASAEITGRRTEVETRLCGQQEGPCRRHLLAGNQAAQHRVVIAA